MRLTALVFLVGALFFVSCKTAHNSHEVLDALNVWTVEERFTSDDQLLVAYYGYSVFNRNFAITFDLDSQSIVDLQAIESMPVSKTPDGYISRGLDDITIQDLNSTEFKATHTVDLRLRNRIDLRHIDLKPPAVLGDYLKVVHDKTKEIHLQPRIDEQSNLVSNLGYVSTSNAENSYSPHILNIADGSLYVSHSIIAILKDEDGEFISKPISMSQIHEIDLESGFLQSYGAVYGLQPSLVKDRTVWFNQTPSSAAIQGRRMERQVGWYNLDDSSIQKSTVIELKYRNDYIHMVYPVSDAVVLVLTRTRAVFVDLETGVQTEHQLLEMVEHELGLG